MLPVYTGMGTVHEFLLPPHATRRDVERQIAAYERIVGFVSIPMSAGGHGAFQMTLPARFIRRMSGVPALSNLSPGPRNEKVSAPSSDVPHTSRDLPSLSAKVKLGEPATNPRPKRVVPFSSKRASSGVPSAAVWRVARGLPFWPRRRNCSASTARGDRPWPMSANPVVTTRTVAPNLFQIRLSRSNRSRRCVSCPSVGSFI